MKSKMFNSGSGKLDLNGITLSSNTLNNDRVSIMFPKIKANDISITYSIKALGGGDYATGNTNMYCYNDQTRVSNESVSYKTGATRTKTINDGRIINLVCFGSSSRAILTNLSVTFNNVEIVED